MATGSSRAILTLHHIRKFWRIGVWSDYALLKFTFTCERVSKRNRKGGGGGGGGEGGEGEREREIMITYKV